MGERMIVLGAALLALLPFGQEEKEVERLLNGLIPEDGIVQFLDEEFPDLAKLGWPKVVPFLCRIVSDKDFPYRYLEKRTLIRKSYDREMKDLAIAALARSGDAKVSVPVLREFLRESDSRQLKESALAALCRLGEKQPVEDFLRKTEAEASEAMKGADKDGACKLLFRKALMLARIRRADESEATHLRIVGAIEEHKLRESGEQLLSISLYNIATLRARKGDKVKAIEWLEKAIRAGFRDREFIRADKDFDSLRNEEQFKRLLADDKLFATPEEKK